MRQSPLQRLNDVDLRVAIVGTALEGAIGGLASYQRLLYQALTDEIGVTNCISMWRTDQAPRVASGSLYNLNLGDEQAKLLRFTTRPVFHGLVEKWLNCRFGKLFEAIRRFEPSVVHFIGTGYDLIGFPLKRIADELNAKFTIWPAIHPNSWGDDVIDIRLYRHASGIFCQSDYESEHLGSLGIPSLQRVRCGLPPMCRSDGNGMRFRNRWGLANEPVVFFLGRLDQGKGFFAMLEAWSEVQQSFSDAKLVVAGPGEARPNQAGVLDMGRIDEQEKADAYAACDVFCLPSAHESFGIVYVEAWSYGKPVICGEAPAARELVVDGVDGIHACQEASTLAASICRLLGDSRLSRALGETGRQVQSTAFTTKKMYEAHVEAWKRL